MKKIIIAGAGGFGKEVAWIISRINQVHPEFQVVGFCDDDQSTGADVSSIAPFIGSVDDVITKHVGCGYICAIGNNENRKNVMTALDWLSMAYNIFEDNLFDAIHNNPGYVGINAPRTINNRYITEDVPMSLVPISEFGKRFGVETKATDSLIDLANIIFKNNFRQSGRNLTRLGLDNLDLEQIRAVFIEGKLKK